MPLTTASARLLELDPDLADGLPSELRERLRPHIRVTALALPPGVVDLEEVADATARAETLLVAAGLVMRETVIADITATAIHGPGDLVSLGASPDTLVPTQVTWTAAAPTTVVPVDRVLVGHFPTWPGLASRLLARGAEQSRREVVLRAIAQLPRVEMRVLGLLWHLAERWGHVSSAGVVVPISLTHEMLGRLVGARRPTVSLALKELAARGDLNRRADGAWVLARESLAPLAVQTSALTSERRLGLPAQAPLAGTANRLRLAPARVGGMSPAERAALRDHTMRLKEEIVFTASRVEDLLARTRATRERVRRDRSSRRRERSRRRSPSAP